ncbi:MAG: hypothetical protein ACP5QG_05360 [candidate division WOR-3 bacterium]
MKKYLLIIGTMVMVSGCIGGMGQGCGGCISSTVKKEIEKQTGLDLGGEMSHEEMEKYRLTDADVEKYIRDFPKLAKDFKELGESIEKTPGKPMKGLATLVGSEKMMAELRAMGWNPPEKFFAVHYAIMMSTSYNAMKAGMEELPGDLGESKKQMEQLLNDPNIPPDQKRQIRESLKEMDKVQEQMNEQIKELEKNTEIRHNAGVVERHMDDLERMFNKLD